MAISVQCKNRLVVTLIKESYYDTFRQVLMAGFAVLCMGHQAMAVLPERHLKTDGSVDSIDKTNKCTPAGAWLDECDATDDPTIPE